MIDQSDVFVFLDEVQFTRRDWRSRNKIKSANGSHWLSVPVRAESHQDLKISEVHIDYQQDWIRKHLKSVEQSYSKAPFFEQTWDSYRKILEERPATLSKLNQLLTQKYCDLVSGNVAKKFLLDSDLAIEPNLSKTERLVAICRAVGADRYLSGPSAREYLELNLFKVNNIEVDFAGYSFQEYQQLHGEFDPQVSIIDSLMNLGVNCRQTLFEGGVVSPESLL